MARKRKKKLKIKNRKIDFGIVVLVILLAAFTVGAFIWNKSSRANREISAMRVNQPEKAAIKLQDYRNEKYGFELKYPETWKLLDGEETFPGINFGFSPINIDKYPACKTYIDDLKGEDKNAEFFGRNQYCIVSVIIAKKSKNLSLKDYLKKTYDDSMNIQKIDSLEIKTINGFEVVKTSEYSFVLSDNSIAGADKPLPDIENDYEQFIIDGKDEVIFITNNVEDEMNKTDSVFNQIISTFKFTEES